MEALISKYRNLLQQTDISFVRGLSNKINWNARAVCIEGARGTGKSTLMLQHIKSTLPLHLTLYLSLDDLYFKQHSLLSVAERFYQEGGRYLFLDEVHKYADWQTEVKNLYDFKPQLHIVVSGSSILALQQSNADLSRRLLRYHLPELSLREFIALKTGVALPEYQLHDLLESHQAIVDDIKKSVTSPLKFFREYLTYGAYPFFKEGESEYLMRIQQLINVIIDYDLPEARPMEVSTLAKLKKLLYIISTAVPFTPNITRLAEQISTSRNRLLDMLELLEKAQLIRNLRSSSFGISLMNKPEKVFLHNNSLIMALAEGQANSGNLRETFFFTQLNGAGYRVSYPKTGDFLVEQKYTFEVGGKNKTFKQIADEPEAYLAIDDLEYGTSRKIPLWLFGFLY
ncbi:ATP-binding protein [Sphingobacterium sp. SGR-19]|uniref:ATP-binding protein n=1 Tax=Sphingobacterium sp. SGR-19 TaxID=2710886 RepID=UPI0013ECBC1B|nr:AAA family ATPase [Sphingobacterium sp. SGR-19]NGM65810.1 AAA family ATPase [Sphingobacterium sp. SGR-19]